MISTALGALASLPDAAVRFAEAVKPDAEAARIRAAAAAQRREGRSRLDLVMEINHLDKARAKQAGIARHGLTARRRENAAELVAVADRTIADLRAQLAQMTEGATP